MTKTKRITVADVARHVGGALEGNGDAVVTTLAPLDEAGPDAVSWVGDARYAAQLPASRAAAVLVSADVPAAPGKTLIRVADPDRAMISTLELLAPPVDAVRPGVHESAIVDPSAVVTGAAIGAHVVVGANTTIAPRAQLHAGVRVGSLVSIGADTILHPNVVVRERVTIGSRVIVHANSTIGSDGFSYLFRDGAHQKVPQIGTVIIEDDVEIGSNTTIDRARSGATRIGQGTKIDNQVQIGHNVQVGKHCIIISFVGIGGSAVLGDYSVLAGQSALSDHCTVGRGVRAAAKALITKNIPDGMTVRGNPAVEAGQSRREDAAVRKLDEALKTIRRLSRRVDKLERNRRPRD